MIVRGKQGFFLKYWIRINSVEEIIMDKLNT